MGLITFLLKKNPQSSYMSKTWTRVMESKRVVLESQALDSHVDTHAHGGSCIELLAPIGSVPPFYWLMRGPSQQIISLAMNGRSLHITEMWSEAL